MASIKESWGSIPQTVRVSVAVSVAMIALILLVPSEHRTKAIEPFTYVFAAVTLFAFSLYNWRQHTKALHGNQLKWLHAEGLVIEQLGAYHGFKGIYRGYFMRVYVDPESHFTRQYWPTLCVLVYYKPMRTREGKRDIALLRRVENGLLNETNWRHAEHINCYAIHMRSFTVLRPWVSRRKVKIRIDKVVDRVIKYGLKPWADDQVAKWVNESPDLHGPDIDLFQANFRNPTAI